MLRRFSLRPFNNSLLTSAQWSFRSSACHQNFMAEKPAENTPKPSKEVLDLNSLSGLDFGPSWADGKSKGPERSYNERKGGEGRRGKSRAGAGSRDRRGAGGRSRPSDQSPRTGAVPTQAPAQSGSGRGSQRSGDFRSKTQRPVRDIFKPTVKVDLYPQDEAFEALVKRLRATVRTYQLFEIAHLLLEKPERFVVVVSNFPNKGAVAPMFYSVPGHLPFDTEEAAVAYVLKHHLDTFFEIETIEVAPPKGSFQMVNRCGMTGELLGPPNYHRYQEFLQRHYNERIQGASYERFTAKIETVKEQEVIDAWLESMKQGHRYTLKDRVEGEPESFESLEAVKHFLLQHRKDKVVGSGETIRFAGRDIVRMPEGDLRQSVEAYVEQQKHFPLDTANNIRGRLRRHKFTVYKKGSKGVSFVCAVKRKFRDSVTVFTDSIQGLIEFIEKNPEIAASKLPKAYIGIDTEKQKPDKLVVSEADIKAAKEAAEQADATESGEADAEASEVTHSVSPAAAASTDATPKVELAADEQKQLNQLMLDLRWLIVEGYVTEYGDGRLFAAPPMPEPKKETAEPIKKKPKPKQDLPKSETEENVVTEPKASVAEETVKAPKAEALATETSPEIARAETPEAEKEPEVEAPTPEKKAESDTKDPA